MAYSCLWQSQYDEVVYHAQYLSQLSKFYTRIEEKSDNASLQVMLELLRTEQGKENTLKPINR